MLKICLIFYATHGRWQTLRSVSSTEIGQRLRSERKVASIPLSLEVFLLDDNFGRFEVGAILFYACADKSHLCCLVVVSGSAPFLATRELHSQTSQSEERMPETFTAQQIVFAWNKPMGALHRPEHSLPACSQLKNTISKLNKFIKIFFQWLSPYQYHHFFALQTSLYDFPSAPPQFPLCQFLFPSYSA